MQPVNYKLVRKPYRRTLSIEITPKNEIIIKASKTYPLEKINRFLSRKHKWIQKQIIFNQNVRKPPFAREYRPGEKYLYLGRQYTLLLQEGESFILIDRGNLIIRAPKRHLNRKKYLRDKLKEWYRKEAYAKILQRVSFFENVFAVSVSDLKVRYFGRSWGNCSKKRKVTFSPYLVMAPVSVIDYVVAHELAHILIPNHSPEFWKFLKKFIPGYKLRKQWLIVHENQFCI